MAPDLNAGVTSKLEKIRRDGEERDAKRRADAQKLPYVDLRNVPVSLEAIKLIEEPTARAANVAAIEMKPHEVALAVFDSQEAGLTSIIADLKNKKYEVKFFIASQSGLEQVWKLYEYVSEAQKEITGKLSIETARREELSEKLKTFQLLRDAFAAIDFTRVTTTDLFEMVIVGALANRSSDVHIESGEKVSKIRFRIDGILHDVFSDIPPRNQHNLISRIKLVSGLKINVREEPQDGRFTIHVGGSKEIEVRVSIIPSEFGETIVMRILDPSALAVDLRQLGLRPDDLALVEAELKRPNGLILNTGPTGSGKTTTLYAFLKHVASPEIKVITIEDPIEYRVEGILQTQVDADAGYTFASGLRSIVRQDPDVILVGEIRDTETADISMQAALTGHLVFSTLHTNDAVGAIPRLVDLNIKPATIGPAVSLVIAQRLVRRLCDTCKKAVPLDGARLAKFSQCIKNLPERVDRTLYAAALADAAKAVVYEPVGCEVCGGFGYKGRVGIFEFFKVTPEVQEVIVRSAAYIILQKLAVRQQMISMQQDGVLKVIAGQTSIAEVEDVTGPLAL